MRSCCLPGARASLQYSMRVDVFMAREQAYIHVYRTAVSVYPAPWRSALSYALLRCKKYPYIHGYLVAVSYTHLTLPTILRV